MATRDGLSKLRIRPLIPPAIVVTNNTATVSSIIDTQGYDEITLAIVTGTLTDADATFAVTVDEGDASNLSDAAAVAAADLVSMTPGTAALTAASYTFGDDNETRAIGYVGSKRYVRLTVTPSANTGDHYVAGIAILSGKAPAMAALGASAS